MSGNEILSKITTIIHNQFPQKKLSIGAETYLKDIDGWDSLRHVLVMAEIEKSFGIKIDFMELLEIRTIDDLLKTIQNHLQ